MCLSLSFQQPSACISSAADLSMIFMITDLFDRGFCLRYIARRLGKLRKSFALSRFLQKIRQVMTVYLSLQAKSTTQGSQTHQFTSRYVRKLHIDTRRHQLTRVDGVLARRFTLTITAEMADRLEEERRRRLLDSVPETIRTILSEHLAGSMQTVDRA